MPETPSLPRLTVITREIPVPDDLLRFTSPDAPLTWLRRGDGFVGSGGVALTLSETGVGRAEKLAARWRAIAEVAEIDDTVNLPGTGLLAFGALAFDDRSQAASTLVVPAAVVGRRGGTAWLTTISVDAPVETPWGPSWSATLGPGSLDPQGYQDAVSTGLDAIAAGEVGKVVLARDLVGSAPAGADLRRLVRELSSGYPDCWAFAVDGFVGASPETLVTVSHGTVTCTSG